MFYIVNEEGDYFEEAFLSEDEAIEAAKSYFDTLINEDESFEAASHVVSNENGQVFVTLFDEDEVVEELEIIQE